MFCVRNLTKSALVCGIVVAVLCSLSPAVATAQSVRGHGEISNGPGISPSQISVNAGLDASGIPYGRMTWTGGASNTPPYTPGTGGPVEPYIMDVYEIFFYGNTALVYGVVVNSPQGQYDGITVSFFFTDNSAIGEPDEIDFQPIEAGNITVKD